MSAGLLGSEGEWGEACVRQADRVLLVVADDSPAGPAASLHEPLPTPTDVVLLGGPGNAATDRLLDTLKPRTTYRVGAGERRREDVAAIARRLAGRSVGLVLSGGGARGFCHIGAIEALEEFGVRIDRIAGTSMGAFIGALAARGASAEEIDACCYEEWVRRNPISDYRLSRTSLIRGERVRAMLMRHFPGRIEDLRLGFSCMSVDLISATAIRLKRGPLAASVGASMSLPIIAPPVVLDRRLLTDGSLMDNLPTEVLAGDGEGPIIAVDVSEPSVRAPRRRSAGGSDAARDAVQGDAPQRVRRRSAALVRRRADPPGLRGHRGLEFHMLDRMRVAGHTAAAAALADAPRPYGPERAIATRVRGSRGRRVARREDLPDLVEELFVVVGGYAGGVERAFAHGDRDGDRNALGWQVCRDRSEAGEQWLRGDPRCAEMPRP